MIQFCLYAQFLCPFSYLDFVFHLLGNALEYLRKKALKSSQEIVFFFFFKCSTNCVPDSSQYNVGSLNCCVIVRYLQTYNILSLYHVLMGGVCFLPYLNVGVRNHKNDHVKVGRV